MDRDGAGVSIQDQYLGRARKDRAWLTVVLNSGKKIGGRIVSFDRYTVILEDRGSEQMVFKHAIATVSVSRSFSNTIDLDRAAANTEKRSPAPKTRTVGGGRPAPDRPVESATTAETAAPETPAGAGPNRSGTPTAR